MTLNDAEQLIRQQFDVLQYLAFFGMFAVFAILETAVPRDPAPHSRLWRWPTNILLTATNIVITSAIPVTALAAADFAQKQQMGILNIVEFEVTPLAAFAAGFLGRAFLSWGTHILNHKVPFLWAIHRVHHADTRLDVSTTVRFHPLEFVFTIPITLAGIVLLGAPPISILLYEVLDAGITVFSHANVRLPWWIDRPLSLLIVTPDVHRVHHSSSQPETDSNYGAVLTIWDRLLGTYRRKQGDALVAQETGLSEVQDSRSRNPLWLLVLPFIELRRRPTPPQEHEK